MSLETISLSHPSGAKISLLPSLGFNCYQWQVPSQGKPRELLWFDPDLPSGKARPTRSGIPLLFPFAGRIRDPLLTFEGKTYDIADTLDDFGQPIHGFVLKRPWRVVAKSLDSVTGEFQASVDDPTLLAKWPADYRIRVSYQLAEHSLRSEVEVFNPDTRLLPFTLGTHPYFRLPLASGGTLGQCVLRVPARYHWRLSDRLIPTCELHATPLTEQLTAGLTLGDMRLDELLTDLEFVERRFQATVTDPAAQLRLTVEFGNEFANCVLFIPPHREAVCIEPYTSSPDAFRMQTMGMNAHLRLLHPGSTWKASIEMRMEADRA
jgi:aldose 1-epimerase